MILKKKSPQIEWGSFNLVGQGVRGNSPCEWVETCACMCDKYLKKYINIFQAKNSPSLWDFHLGYFSITMNVLRSLTCTKSNVLCGPCKSWRASPPNGLCRRSRKIKLTKLNWVFFFRNTLPKSIFWHSVHLWTIYAESRSKVLNRPGAYQTHNFKLVSFSSRLVSSPYQPNCCAFRWTNYEPVLLIKLKCT